ncbi:MAG: hypothetical protein GY896_24290, partial [Gammaproteobacteria bacterium]|nr:hypothetical protein [Gammaproteobacteria bacterium]
CDLLVLTLPFNLIKDLDIDARILDEFSPEKKMAIDRIASSDNGKLLIEFADRHWDTVLNIHGSDVHSNGRAYSKPDGFISTWEGDPGSPSEMGILVDYTGGAASRSMRRWDALGVAQYEDVERTLGEWENIWPGISAKYTGDAANVRAWQCNWLDHRYSKGAFVSPATETMTVWWGAQWETEGNIYFAGEACDEEYWSYMNGAILSGERVAKEIHQR